MTPSHLLTGHKILGLLDNLCYSESVDLNYEVDPSILTRQMKCLNQSIDYFRKWWRSEYLLSLSERQKFLHSSKGKPNIMVGDVVVVHDETKRGFWNLGVIKAL